MLVCLLRMQQFWHSHSLFTASSFTLEISKLTLQIYGIGLRLDISSKFCHSVVGRHICLICCGPLLSGITVRNC